MNRSPRRRRAYASRRSSSGGTSALILLAALLLVCGMGIAIQAKQGADATPMDRSARVPAPASESSPARAAAAPAPRVAAPASLVSAVTRTVREAEAETRALRTRKRDAGFTQVQTDTMAALSAARGELGAWLDEHPNDERANKLWDRLQRVYITLKKL